MNVTALLRKIPVTIRKRLYIAATTIAALVGAYAVVSEGSTEGTVATAVASAVGAVAGALAAANTDTPA